MSSAPGSGPVFRLQKLYVKDLSFENPNAPEIFRDAPKLQAEVNLTLHNKRVDDRHWEVVLRVTATVKSGERVAFIVEVEHGGLFLLQNIPDEHLATVLAVDCPAYLFPFTRQVVYQAVEDGGFPPFLLEPVNFPAMYREAQKARTEKKDGAH